MKTLPQIYSQRDSRWATQRLGTVNNTTIGDYGCYVTSMAMVASYFGNSVTPSELDDIFTNNKWYSDGNMMVDNNLHKAYSDIIYKSSLDFSSVPADLSKLQQLNSDVNTLVILEVDFNPSQIGVQTHFVVCVDCDGIKVTIADPWTGTICDITKYGKAKTTIQKFVIYSGNAVVTEETLPVKKSDFENLVSKSSEYDKFVAGGYLHLEEVQNLVHEKEQTIQNLTQDINSCETQVGKLLDDAQKINETDKNTSAELLDAQHALQPLKDEILAINKMLGLMDDTDSQTTLKALEILKSSKVKPAPKPITFWEKFVFLFS